MSEDDGLGPRDWMGRFCWILDDDGTPVSKTCPECLRHLPASNYGISRQTRSGLMSNCVECARARRSRNYHAGGGTKKQRDRFRERTYGVSPADVAAMMKAQGGVCALCGCEEDGHQRTRSGKPAPFHVDHCHKTGLFRGMLCQQCNTALGRIEKVGIENIAAYLRGGTASIPDP